MLLYRWQGEARNFGDELNTLLWPRLLPGLLDDDPSTLFLGIGSVLDARHGADVTKVVAGTGYGGYEGVPKLDASWVIHWVRGPGTAHLLGLPAELGLGDPAMLLPMAGFGHANGGRTVGFMPHFESLPLGAWPEVAALAGIDLIDPRDDPAGIIAAIGNCRLLLTEAMHGAIVADALRVPWIALQPLMAVHRAKWHDWADVLGLQVMAQPLPPSSLLEWLRASRLTLRRRGRQLLRLAGPVLRGVNRRRFISDAAEALIRAAGASPQLSAAASLERCQTRMLERLEHLRRNPLEAWPEIRAPPPASARGRL